MPQINRDDVSRVARATFVRAAGLGLVLAAVLVCAGASAARAGDDSDGPSLYDRFLRTLGLRNPGAMEYGINYNERSPLVVPPTRDLPPPQSAAAPNTPDWPKDPDIAAREASQHTAKVGPHPDNVLENERALRPDELNVHGAGSGDSHGGVTVTDDRYPDAGSKKSFFNLGWLNPNKEQYATFTGEPARTSLTEPPPGYLTPSPDQPYGIAPEKKQYHVETPSEHGELTR